MRSPKGASPFVALAAYGAAGLQLAASVVAGLLIGDYIDRRAGLSPWCTAAGLVAGFVAGIVNLVRIVRRIEMRGDDGGGEGE